MSLIRKHGAVLQAWACLALVLLRHSPFLVYIMFKLVMISIRNARRGRTNPK